MAVDHQQRAIRFFFTHVKTVIEIKRNKIKFIRYVACRLFEWLAAREIMQDRIRGADKLKNQVERAKAHRRRKIGPFRYKLRFDEVSVEQRPHFVAQIASVGLSSGDRAIGELRPALNHYPTQMQPLGSPAVRTTAGHDLYLTLMNVGGDGTIGLRAIVTPGVVWIWIGVFIIVAGTTLCLVPPAAAGGAARP